MSDKYLLYICLPVSSPSFEVGDSKMCLLVRTAAGKDTQMTVTGNNSIKVLGIYIYIYIYVYISTRHSDHMPDESSINMLTIKN